MKTASKKMVGMWVVFLSVFLLSGQCFGFDIALGKNITIPDGVGLGSNWYGAQEDNEVEPGCLTGQGWDLEAFFFNRDTGILSVVGGYDFRDGLSDFLSGDIFIDVDGDAKYGTSNDPQLTNGYSTVSNTFGYDFVVDLDFSSLTYNIFELTGASTVTVFYSANYESNPWRYAGGGIMINENDGPFDFGYSTGKTDLQIGGGLTGGLHNVVNNIDLGYFLDPTLDFTAHITEGCGNDNLMGQNTAPVPEPATMLLLGTGLVGLASYRRRWKK